MRSSTPPIWRSVLLAVTLTASASLWAQPFGYGINSRGDFTDDEKVGALWTINLATGEADREGRERIANYVFIEGLAFGPDERLYGADDDTNTLLVIGLQTGNAVQAGSPKRDNNMRMAPGVYDFGMTFTCDGNLLVSSDSNEHGQTLYSADIETGKLSPIGDLGASIVDMASIGDRIYGIGRGMDAAGNPKAPNLYLIDPEAPSAELIGPLGDEAGPYNKAGLATDETGNLWAVTDRRGTQSRNTSQASEILRIDPLTGTATKVAETRTASNGEALVGIESLAVSMPTACDFRSEHLNWVVDIPVFSNASRWVLILLLAGLALTRLRSVQS